MVYKEDLRFYCPHCDVEVGRAELLDGCCPFCGTEIPEAVEGKNNDAEISDGTPPKI